MNATQLASFFKCLSEPVRVRLLSLLMQRGELCVCDLVTGIGEAQSVVSRHLAYLRGYQLVTAERRGIWMFYRLAPSIRSDFKGVWSLLAEHAAAGELAEDLARIAMPGACCETETSLAESQHA